MLRSLAISLLLLAAPASPGVVVVYSRLDAEQASKAASLLRLTTPVFMDVNMPPGVLWRSEVHRELCAATWVLLVWSKNAQASVEVGHEWRAALECGRAVVPLLLDETLPPSPLLERQWIDWKPLVRP